MPNDRALIRRTPVEKINNSLRKHSVLGYGQATVCCPAVSTKTEFASSLAAKSGGLKLATTEMKILTKPERRLVIMSNTNTRRRTI